MNPTLVVNPASDRLFAEFATMIVDHGVDSTSELELRLKAVYPDATVHARELVGERTEIWYVYRDGRWVHSGDAADAPGSARSDI